MIGAFSWNLFKGMGGDWGEMGLLARNLEEEGWFMVFGFEVGIIIGDIFLLHLFLDETGLYTVLATAIRPIGGSPD